MVSNSNISVPKHVLSESLNDETVVLDMSSGMYFGLSPVASRFWTLLGEGVTRDEIHSILQNEFDVDAEVLRADLDGLLADLEAKKLIQRQAN
jgi:hypothetical protein